MLADARDPARLPAHRWAAPICAIGLLLAGSAAASCFLLADRHHEAADSPSVTGSDTADPPAKTAKDDPFRGWPADRKPDVALVLTGQQHSYLKFCGCSMPQLGGFERRSNFLARMKERGWPIVAVDLGDLVMYKEGVQEQAFLKYETAMKLLKLLDYRAMGLGEFDFKLPLLEGLTRTVLQDPDGFPSALVSNLNDQSKRREFPIDEKRSMIGDIAILSGTRGAPRIGVASVVAPGVARAINDPRFTFEPNNKLLPGTVQRLEAAKVDLKVLLYHGDVVTAVTLAKSMPDQFDVILCLSAEDEPPSRPEQVGRTMVVRVGHRGRYVGVIGAYQPKQAGKPYELHYTIVPMGEEYETPKDQEKDHRVLGLLEDYAAKVKEQRFLQNYPRGNHPMQALFANQKVEFVGSERCQTCHAPEYKIWKEETKHPKAYKALEEYAVKPSLRQYDPECVRCHVVGMEYSGGFVDEKASAHLKGVGCESCHGPGSLHVDQPMNGQFRMALSPWKVNPGDYLPTPVRLKESFETYSKDQQSVFLRINDACRKCHDSDNDPHFKLAEYWPKIAHGKKTPKPVVAAKK